eukprot:6490530-Amphidinium_carterae.1
MNAVLANTIDDLLWSVLEKLCDITAFLKTQTDLGKSREEGLAEWRRLEQDSNVERVGSGPTLQLWCPAAKTRFRDKTIYSDARLEEGSKQQKGATVADRQELLDAVRTQDTSHADAWLHKNRMTMKAEESQPSVKAEAVKAEVAKIEKGEVAIAAPKATEKNQRLVPELERAILKEMESGRQVFSQASPADEKDKLTSSYMSVARARLQLLEMWNAEGLAVDSPPCKPSASAFMDAVTGLDVSVQVWISC